MNDQERVAQAVRTTTIWQEAYAAGKVNGKRDAVERITQAIEALHQPYFPAGQPGWIKRADVLAAVRAQGEQTTREEE